MARPFVVRPEQRAAELAFRLRHIPVRERQFRLVWRHTRSGVPFPLHPGKRTPDAGAEAGRTGTFYTLLSIFLPRWAGGPVWAQKFEPALGAPRRRRHPGPTGCGAAPAMEQGGSDAAHPHRATGSGRRAGGRDCSGRLHAGRSRQSGLRSHRPQSRPVRCRIPRGFRHQGRRQGRQEEERQEEIQRRVVEVLEEEGQEEVGLQGRLGQEARSLSAFWSGPLGTAGWRVRSLCPAARRVGFLCTAARRVRSVCTAAGRLRPGRSRRISGRPGCRRSRHVTGWGFQRLLDRGRRLPGRNRSRYTS